VIWYFWAIFNFKVGNFRSELSLESNMPDNLPNERQDCVESERAPMKSVESGIVEASESASNNHRANRRSGQPVTWVDNPPPQ
jgi:hypothetical protein